MEKYLSTKFGCRRNIRQGMRLSLVMGFLLICSSIPSFASLRAASQTFHSDYSHIPVYGTSADIFFPGWVYTNFTIFDRFGVQNILILSGLLFLIILIVLYFWRISRLQHEQNIQHLLSQKLIESQEQERKRIAQELHDSLGQNILIMKTTAELALRSLDDKAAVTERLQEIASLATDTLQESREIAYNLRPLHLDRLGLTEALKTLLESVSKISTTSFDYDIDNVDEKISKEHEIDLYRIVQESINNILKHSGASVASVKVRRMDTAIVVTIQDNGKGFKTLAMKGKQGLGLVGIKERAHILHAISSIYSEEGKGTRLSISIPVQRESV